MKKCVIICNPNSGKNDKKQLITKFEKILNKYNYNLETIYTKYSGHAKEIVKGLPDNIDLLVSLGGDGTFNEVVSGNIKRKNKLLLCHIPLGTTNDIGAMFGMTKDPESNLKMTLEGAVKEIDICTINNHVFVYVAGLGKFTNIAYETPREMKKRFGYLAYIINAFKIFNSKTKLFEMEYTANGETYKGLYSLVLVTNATRMAGFDIFKNVTLNDGKFEVLMTNITRKKDIIKTLYLVTKQKDASKVPGVYFCRTDHLKISLVQEPKKNWCIDGEQLKEKNTKYEIKIVKGTKMLLPKKAISKVFVAND
ncbi:MAG: YegS/Rv2252/BmrU family lipid kinase [Bacilli bacterium]|nr:YegS/Rv2252/BmrU family lipid kinase [Bacilli bacterium]